MTYIFDIWTWVDSDNITVLDAEIVANNTIHPGASIIKIIVGQDNEYCILSLLALN